LKDSVKSPKPDRWWIIALCAAIVGTCLVILLWNFPTSKWVWLLAGFILLFVAVLNVNPRYRYWRRANWCFGIAGVLAFVPSFVAKANLEGIGAFDLASDASPLVVLGFLAAGLVLAWLDSRQQVHSLAKAGIASTNANLNSVNSPHSVTGLTAGGNITINHGVSEETLLAVIDAQQVASRIKASSGIEPREVDEELVWQLIDDIKDARRRFEREDVAKLLANLQKSFERSGNRWTKVLRTEALLLMAEEERARISRLRVDGNQVDLTRLQEMLKELRDA
jgi:signal transduction histidine kinase